MLRALALLSLAGCHVVFGADTPDGGADPGCWNAALRGNEDGDAAEDGCDSCPADTDLVGVVRDRDGDGVGDACDPDAARNHWVLFEGFYAPPHEWQARQGQWDVGDDGLRSIEAIGGRATRAVAPTLRPAIEASLRLLSEDAEDAAGVELVFDATSARCSYMFADGNDRLVLEVTGRQPMTTSFNSASGVRIRMYQDSGRRIHCEAFGPQGSSDELRSNELPNDVTTEVGLFATHAPATFAWVAVLGVVP